MTPKQLAALEGLISRTLTVSEILELDALLIDRNDVAIAATLSSWQPKVRKSLTVEDMYDVLYFTGDYLTLKSAQLAGNALAVMCFSILLDAKQIGPGTVNLGLQQTQGLLSQLQAANLISQAGIDALDARSLVDAPAIHYNTVSDVLNVAEDRLTLGG